MAKHYVAELAGVLVVQAEMRILFHHIQRVAAIVHKVWNGFGVQHIAIVTARRPASNKPEL
jgi:hypothetical protein